jgi:hypothetical protein
MLGPSSTPRTAAGIVHEVSQVSMLRAQDHERAKKRTTVSKYHSSARGEVESLHVATPDWNRLDASSHRRGWSCGSAGM